MGPSPEKILMGPSSKKRRYQRYILTFPMDLYRMDYKDNRYDAELIDCCNKGLSLMTNEKLVIGEFIYFELKNCDTNVLLPFIKKKNYIGIVRWEYDIRQPMPELTVFTNMGSNYQRIINNNSNLLFAVNNNDK